MKTSLALPFLSLICFLYISVKVFVYYGDSYSSSSSSSSITTSISGTDIIRNSITNGDNPDDGSSNTNRIFSFNNDEKKENNQQTMSESSSNNKTSWPEVVGKMTGEEAKKVIEETNPTITVIQILPENSIVTMDYSISRVRIFVNDDGIVATTPTIG